MPVENCAKGGVFFLEQTPPGCDGTPKSKRHLLLQGKELMPFARRNVPPRISRNNSTIVSLFILREFYHADWAALVFQAV